MEMGSKLQYLLPILFVMQLKSFFQDNAKAVATHKLKSGGLGNLIAIRLLSSSELPKHKTPVPASLILLEGSASYEELEGEERKVEMVPGTLVQIPEEVTHRLLAGKDGALLILVQ
jgi:quercetin dioxygenase-like cupin family protein